MNERAIDTAFVAARKLVSNERLLQRLEADPFLICAEQWVWAVVPDRPTFF